MTRTVVVTGGAKGIGLATVRAFRDTGDRVVALGRDAGALAALEPLGVLTHVCDVTDEAAVRSAFAGVGAVDVLVNNAGIGESASLAATTLADFRRHLDVNVTGAFLCLREVLTGMRGQGSGVIVNVASTAGRVGVPYTSAYSASKHALVGLTRAAAAELAGTGIRVNAVCPTFVATELTDRSITTIVERTGRSHHEAEASLAAASPLGRLLEPEEVATAILFLASPGAAAVNGQALVIDGGGIQA